MDRNQALRLGDLQSIGMKARDSARNEFTEIEDCE